jgi:hypothetical protein
VGTYATFFQRILVVLAATGLFACGGDGDFGFGGGDGEDVIVPVIGTIVDNSFQPDTVGIEPMEISAGGVALLTVAVVWSDTGEPVFEPLDIEFNSQCASEDPPRAVITPQLQTQANVYQAEYEATGCVGDDVIVVTVGGVVAVTGVISIQSPEVGTLQFVSAVPERIALSGFGSATFPEFSDVTFRVLDANGLPVPGRTVSFELTDEIGGASLVNTSAVSDQAGDVVARVQSGIVNATVRVIASYTTADGQLLQTISGPIAINSGLADPDSFDIATSVFNPLAFNYNYSLGEEAPVTISVFAADYFNNPVPDGTQVSFVSESGGQIEGNCPTENGACSVFWASSGLRPADGVLTLVARVVGEESFDDTNGNGLFDIAELPTVDQRPEAWLDANENGVYDAGVETFFDFNTDGVRNPANNLYDGAGCTESAQAAGHCAALVEARQPMTLVLSGDDVSLGFFSDVDAGGNCTGPLTNVDLTSQTEQSVCYTLADGRQNIPPFGTAVSVSTNNGSIIAGEQGYTIPNQLRSPKFGDPLWCRCVTVQADEVAVDAVTEQDTGFLEVTVSVPSPSSAVYRFSIPVTDLKEVETVEPPPVP